MVYKHHISIEMSGGLEEIDRLKRRMVRGCRMIQKHHISPETSGSSEDIGRFKRRMVPGCRMDQKPYISVEKMAVRSKIVGSREEWFQDAENGPTTS